MKILITGGTGLVGSYLVEKLRRNGHELNILTRHQPKNKNEFYWNVSKEEMDEKALQGIDSIIHLAGANIGKKWTNKHKKAIYKSRIDTANFLFEKCTDLEVELKSYISASGINYYGTFNSDRILKEETGVLHEDFLSDVCVKWEHATWQFESVAERVVAVRTAPVLAKKGGFYPPIKTIADWHLSSGLGDGKQWFNWIHIDDLVSIYEFILENPKIDGPINAVATDIPTNNDFMKEVAKSRGKIFLPFNVPSVILKLTLGEMSKILLRGARVSNDKIKELGYDFKYHHLREALENVNE